MSANEEHEIMRRIAKAHPPRGVARWVVFYPHVYMPGLFHTLAAFSRTPRWL